ncbi:hypothetical protein [Finegoldia magna]|nr:hypothetical protein [Finegoldia magna]
MRNTIDIMVEDLTFSDLNINAKNIKLNKTIEIIRVKDIKKPLYCSVKSK